MAVLGMLTILGAWNDYLWPLVVLASPENQTVQVALSQLRAGYVQDYSLALTGTMLATIPLILVFGALGKQLVGGIMQGAIKG
jgi:cellobiose transport system permease protein